MGWTAPATQTTNTHMTAAIWNEQVTNNLAFLGTNHDHTGDAGHTHNWLHAHTGPSHAHDQYSIAAATVRSDYKIQTEADAGAFTGNQMYWGGTGGGAGPKKVMASGFVAAGTGATGGGTGATANGGTADTGSTAGAATGSADNLPAYIDVVFCKKD